MSFDVKDLITKFGGKNLYIQLTYLFLAKSWAQPIIKIMYQLASLLQPLSEGQGFGSWGKGERGQSGAEDGQSMGRTADPFSYAPLQHKGCGKEASLGSSG